MPDWIHKTTLEQTFSTPSADVPDLPNQLQDPDLSAVSGEPDKNKWVVDNDTVRLKTASELDAEIETWRNQKLERLANAVDEFGSTYYPEKTEYRLKVLRLTALPNRAAKIDEALNWEAQLTTDYMTRRATVQAATTVAQIDAISEDFSNNTPASVVTVPDALEILD